MKNINIAHAGTTGLNSIAEAALGIKPQEAPRLSIGSLVASILREFSTEVSLLVTSSRVLVKAGNLDWAAFQSYLETAITPTYETRFEALPSPLRAKVIGVDGFTVAITPSSTGDAYKDDILVPRAPAYTLLSLLNRVLSIAEDAEEEVVLVINQDSESVEVLKMSSGDFFTLESLIGMVGSADAGSVLFNLTETPDADPVARLGWE